MLKNINFLPVNLSNNNFIPNVVMNAAIKTMENHKDSVFLIVGSASDVYSNSKNNELKSITSYNPSISDIDTVTLISDEKLKNGKLNYRAMINKIINIKDNFRLNVVNILKPFIISSEKIENEYLTVIKNYATPSIQNLHDGQSFKKSVLAPINLNPKVKDESLKFAKDEGLFLPEFSTYLSEKTGHLVCFDKDGKLLNFRVSDDKELFYKTLNEKNIYITPLEPLPLTRKIITINKLITKLEENQTPDSRHFIKWMDRIKDFSNLNHVNDMNEAPMLNDLLNQLMITFKNSVISPTEQNNTLNLLKEFKNVSSKLLKK